MGLAIQYFFAEYQNFNCACAGLPPKGELIVAVWHLNLAFDAVVVDSGLQSPRWCRLGKHEWKWCSTVLVCLVNGTECWLALHTRIGFAVRMFYSGCRVSLLK